jgi:hypothetical protein
MSSFPSSTAQNQSSLSHNQFPPLDQITRPHVPTHQAAHYVDRRPQTLRGWACSGSGPLRPLKINGRLAWPVADIRKLLGV